MRCRKAQEYISRSVDGELSERESVRIERHLTGCADCRELREDLQTIVGQAAELRSPEPSEKVWLNIRAELAARKAKPAQEGPAAERRPFFGWSAPALRYAGVAAVALAFVIAGVAIGRRLGRENASSAGKRGEAYTLAKLDEAEGYYKQAIKSLSEAFTAEKGALAPQIAEFFDRNLSVIDATIQACRAAVLAEPDDLEARNYLLAAYTQKVTLLDSALDLRRRDRDAVVGKKII